MDYADKLTPKPVVHFYAAAPVHNPAAVDTHPSAPPPGTPYIVEGVDPNSLGLAVLTAEITRLESLFGSVAKSGWLVTCLRDLPRGVEA